MNIIKEYVNSFLIKESRGIVIDANHVKETVDFIIRFLIENYNNIGEKKEDEIYGYSFRTSYVLNNIDIEYILTLEFIDKSVKRYEDKEGKNPLAKYTHRYENTSEIIILLKTEESIYDKSQEQFEEIIKLFILSNYNDAYFRENLEISLTHELTHLVDMHYYAGDPDEGGEVVDISDAEYYNNKEELRALISEIYHEVSENIYNSYVLLDSNNFYPELRKEDVSEYIKYSEAFLRAEPYLNKKNKEKVFTQIYTRLVERGFLDLNVAINKIYTDFKRILFTNRITKSNKTTEEELLSFLENNEDYMRKDTYAKNLIFASIFEDLDDKELIEID